MARTAAAQRSADLTAKLLAFARKGKFRAAPVNMHGLIAEVVGIMERSIDRRIHVEQLLRAHPSVTVGDPTLLQNAILNIALNARDAMGGAGTLSVATDVTFLDAPYCDQSPFELKPGRFLQIRVSDTGSGMDSRTVARIFEPFFTTKERGQGTGMGLAAVYGTIKTHHGAIDVESELGKGTTFILYLPLVETEAPELSSNDELVRATGSANILFVDDEDMLCDMVAEMLGELGYTVTVCHNGSDAVQHYRRTWKDIDLVILDMVMPVMAGGEAFDHMKEINPDIQAIIASGFSIEREARRMLEDGAAGFIQKPFCRAELSQKVAQVLAS